MAKLMISPTGDITYETPYEQERELMEAYIAAKAKKRSQWPVHTNRASEMGHPCERYLVYLRLIPPEKRKIIPVSRQILFELGHELEKVAKNDLVEAGFKLYDSPRPEVWKKYNISGSVDTRIDWHGKIIPVEIKGLAPWGWEEINDIDDFYKSKHAYIQKYPGQLLLYMLLHEVDEGFFWLKNKVSNMNKPIWLFLNSYLDYAETLIKKAERINAHVKAETLPDRIKNFLVCRECEFADICLEEYDFGEGSEVVADEPEYEAKLEHYLELKERYKQVKAEYDAIDEEVKAPLEKLPDKKIIVGDKIGISITTQHRNGHTVEPSDYKKITIKRL